MDSTPENQGIRQLTPDAVLRRPRTVSFTRFDQEGLLVVPKQNWQLVLNGVGADAFELVDGKRSVADIAAALASSYPDVTLETITNDTLELFGDLMGRGAVEITPGL